MLDFQQSEDKLNCYIYVTSIECLFGVSTKTWNQLKPAETTYNHLQPSTTIYNHLKNSATTYNHLKNINSHSQTI
ncbi:unnamed protein product [Pocillopora meandrina]|uniref:Uncharacterized protein n=1 Tax=Pocillopora meandrina TaxID=46732 RepID=A0AAU9VU33_9CNID|nr:unnamed protein product [Pocillopora meandrina]